MSSERRATRLLPALIAGVVAAAGCIPWVGSDNMCGHMENRTHFYLDADGDGFGDPDRDMGCEQLEGYVPLDKATDCDDQNPDIHPEANEVCTDHHLGELFDDDHWVDEDCDGLIDDADTDVEGVFDWYPDEDGDGFGCGPGGGENAADDDVLCAPEVGRSLCQGPDGTVHNNDDCDDGDPDENPDAVWYLDSDGDDFGDDDSTLEACGKPEGYVSEPGDCEDLDPNVNPETVWYFDGDGDGYGTTDDAYDTLQTCEPLLDGYTGITPGDTDDDNPYFTTTSPWAVVEAGGWQNCAIRGDRSWACWGSNVFAQLDVDTTLRPIAVSAGQTTVCMIEELAEGGLSGPIHCWGDQIEGITETPELDDFAGLDVGRRNVCGIQTGGSVICWGQDYPRRVTGEDWEQVTELDGATQVVLGPSFQACALDGHGELRCTDGLDVPAGPFTKLRGELTGWCALHDDDSSGAGSISCFNDSGSLLAPDGADYVDVMVGDDWACGLLDTGSGADDIVCVPWRNTPPTPQIDAGRSVRQLSAGSRHACALLDNGELNCWGDNRANQLNAPLSGPYELGAGAHVACGRSSSTVNCWGDDAALQQPRGMWEELQTGRAVVCALSRGGAIGCFGDFADTAVPGGGFTELSLFSEWTRTQDSNPPDTVCGLRTDGTATCWGTSGIGDHDSASSLVAVSAGLDFGCAVTAPFGGLECWGTPPSGRPSSTGWVDIAAGTDHACALAETGEIECWGVDDFGEASNPDPSLHDDFVAVATHTSHSCGLKVSGEVFCWGNPEDGRLEAPDEPPNANFETISVSYQHSCGLRATGEVACWGPDNGTEEKDEDTTSSVSSTPIDTDFVDVSAGPRMSCGLHSDGRISCWGHSPPTTTADPSLGTNSADARLEVGDDFSCVITEAGTIVCAGRDDVGQATPPYASASPYVQLALGDLHGCALDDVGFIDCWGFDGAGQASPPVSFAGEVLAIAAGGSTSCALLNLLEDNIVCWGEDTDPGELLAAPTEGDPWTALDVGSAHACAIAVDGSLLCWGDDSLRQLSWPPLPEPTADGQVRFTGIWAGDNHSCALDSEDHVHCWGDDGDHQVSGAPRYLYRDLALGRAHSCGLQLDRTVVCWGRDTEGQATEPDPGLWSSDG